MCDGPPNWIFQHPAVSVRSSWCRWRRTECQEVTQLLFLCQYQQMKGLEVGDSEQLHAAFLVFMDLTEVRRWKEVSCVKSPELQVVLLEAKEKEGAPVQTVFPLPVHRSLSHRSVRQALDRGFPVLLCAVAADSTLVYQRMTDGLVTPDPPAGPFQDVGRRQHRKRRQQR